MKKKYWKFAKKVLDSILTNYFFSIPEGAVPWLQENANTLRYSNESEEEGTLLLPFIHMKRSA